VKRLELELADQEKGLDSAHVIVRTIFDTGKKITWQATISQALWRPFELFAEEPIIQLFGIYLAFTYGITYLVLTTLPSSYLSDFFWPDGELRSVGIGLFLISDSH